MEKPPIPLSLLHLISNSGSSRPEGRGFQL